MENDFRESHHSKLFYRPIEVAIRWCGLMHLEDHILSETDHLLNLGMKTHSFPCIQQKLAILWDAIRHQELPYGCLGVSVGANETVEPPLLTIRHADLKSWFTQFHPMEKPFFLFSNLERHVIETHIADAYKMLLLEIEMGKKQHERDQTSLQKLQTERDALCRKNNYLTSKLNLAGIPSDRSERAYLRLIGALINLILGRTPSGRPHSCFTSQASIINALLTHNRNKPGFTQRTLESKFAAAKRSMDDSE